MSATVTVISTVTVLVGAYPAAAGGISDADATLMIRWGGLWLAAVGVILTALAIGGGIVVYRFGKDYSSFKKQMLKDFQSFKEQLRKDAERKLQSLIDADGKEEARNE